MKYNTKTRLFLGFYESDIVRKTAVFQVNVLKNLALHLTQRLNYLPCFSLLPLMSRPGLGLKV